MNLVILQIPEWGGQEGQEGGRDLCGSGMGSFQRQLTKEKFGKKEMGHGWSLCWGAAGYVREWMSLL